MQPRRSISNQVFAGLAAIAVAAALSSAVSFYIFRAVGEDFSALAKSMPPIAGAAAKLTQLSERISAKAPSLVAARDDASRRALILDIKNEAKAKDDLLAELAIAEAPPDKIRQIGERFAALMDNMAELDAATAASLETADVLRQDISGLLQVIENTAEPSLEGESRMVQYGRELAMHQATALLRIIYCQDAKEIAGVAAHLDDYSRRLAGLANVLDPVSRHAAAEVARLTTPPDSLFDIKRRDLELRAQITSLLNRHASISFNLTESVDALFAELAVEAGRKFGFFTESYAALATALLSIPLITLAVAFGIHLFIRRGVTGRIIALERALSARAGGDDSPIPFSGEDEIAAMARSVNSFVATRRDFESGLRLAKVQAEAMGQAKSAFLANMSHELRTPLNAVLGFSRIMTGDESLSPGQRENAQIIERSARHLLDLINDILYMSKIEAGGLAASLAPFDLAAMLSDIQAMFISQASGKGVRLELDASRVPATRLIGDEEKLRRVLINLVGNAVKFTPSGTVRVSAAPGLVPGTIHFRVADSGPGLAPDILSQPFSPFVPGRGVMSGAGLGLYIARSLVTIMGGRIEAANAPSGGSVFSCDIPLKPDPSEATATARETREAAGLAPGHAPVRLLVAEDNPDSRLFLAKTLEPAGFTVILAANGEEAVAAFAGSRPDLVLMDMRMPRMDGPTAIREIRRQPDGGGVPIIAMTAGTIDESGMAGADAFLSKPIWAGELLAAIGRLLPVTFVYKDEPGQAPRRLDAAELRAMLRGLPGELTVKLKKAMSELDLAGLTGLLPEVGAAAPRLESELAAMAAEYEVAMLQRLIGELDKEPE